ncbi:NAD-dependent epimerase/dehydratase family protein [Nonomuraea basaltis]|uniref:NAD-dependent epimerase/dehydratase family protein n=1 Tax=Nonomuraea basaltis TaxID=2495887 RepID=UPI0030B81BF0
MISALRTRCEPDHCLLLSQARWVVAWFCMRAALGLPLHLNGGGHQVRDLVHVDDIATGTLHALIAPTAHNQALNLGTGAGTTIRQVAELVRRHYPDATVTETPQPPGDPLGGYACTRRMAELLGWQPGITVTEGVARYAACPLGRPRLGAPAGRRLTRPCYRPPWWPLARGEMPMSARPQPALSLRESALQRRLPPHQASPRAKWMSEWQMPQN